MPKFLRPGEHQGGLGWPLGAGLAAIALLLVLPGLYYRESLPLRFESLCKAGQGSQQAECVCNSSAASLNLTSGGSADQVAAGAADAVAGAADGAAAAAVQAAETAAAADGQQPVAGGDASAKGWRNTYEFDLAPREMQKGLVMWGDTSRARRAMARLLEGKPLRMAAIGGSITKGHNAFIWGQTDYSARIFNWVRKAFPDAPHDLLNGAIGGIQSTYFALCLEWHIPDEVDIVVLENNVNDGPAPPNHPVRRAHERLIRKVLSLPSRPALLELSCYVYPSMDDFKTLPMPFRTGGDDEMGVFAQFYRLPWVSTRALAWGGTPETALDPNATASSRFKPMWDFDMQHPTDTGHRWIADVIVYWMQQTLEGLERQPLEPDDEAYAQAPLTMPLYRDNWEGGTHTCYMAALFRDAVVEHDAAWNWMSEGDPKKPKHGYVSTAPGSYLEFQISTNVGNKVRPQDNVTLGIGHLKSYEHMGMFEAACVSGCTCEPIRCDGHWDLHQSQQQFVPLLVSVSDACRVRVTVLNETSSGEYKVKLMGTILSEVPEDMSPGQAGNVRFGVAEGGKKGTLNLEENHD